jgi:hypothetical protein
VTSPNAAPLPDPAAPALTPQLFAERILQEHERRRQAAQAVGPWSWDDDPDGGKLVALAAMVSRWNVDERGFEDKLRRLIRLPTGVAAPAARRMLMLWWEARSDAAQAAQTTAQTAETAQATE